MKRSSSFAAAFAQAVKDDLQGVVLVRSNPYQVPSRTEIAWLRSTLSHQVDVAIDLEFKFQFHSQKLGFITVASAPSVPVGNPLISWQICWILLFTQNTAFVVTTNSMFILRANHSFIVYMFN